MDRGALWASHMTEWLTQHTCPWHQESTSCQVGMRKVGGLELVEVRPLGGCMSFSSGSLVTTPSSWIVNTIRGPGWAFGHCPCTFRRIHQDSVDERAPEGDTGRGGDGDAGTNGINSGLFLSCPQRGLQWTAGYTDSRPNNGCLSLWKGCKSKINGCKEEKAAWSSRGPQLFIHKWCGAYSTHTGLQKGGMKLLCGAKQGQRRWLPALWQIGTL